MACVITLYLGTRRKPGSFADVRSEYVTPRAWEAFKQDVIIPRFPDGFSVTQAVGHYRHTDGTMVSETTHVLTLVSLDDNDTAAHGAAYGLAQRWREVASQESVLVTIQPLAGAYFVTEPVR